MINRVYIDEMGDEIIELSNFLICKEGCQDFVTGISICKKPHIDYRSWFYFELDSLDSNIQAELLSPKSDFLLLENYCDSYFKLKAFW